MSPFLLCLIFREHHFNLHFCPGPTRPSFHLKLLNLITPTRSLLPGRVTYSQLLDISGGPYASRIWPPAPLCTGHVSFLQEATRKENERLLSEPWGRRPDSPADKRLLYLHQEIKAQRGLVLAQDHADNTRHSQGSSPPRLPGSRAQPQRCLSLRLLSIHLDSVQQASLECLS